MAYVELVGAMGTIGFLISPLWGPLVVTSNAFLGQECGDHDDEHHRECDGKDCCAKE